MPIRYYIGIDAGVNTGFAIWNGNEKKFEVLETYDFWDCILELGKCVKKYLYNGDELVIIIEDVTKNKNTFQRKNTNALMMRKISQNVGSVKRDTDLIIQWFERNKLNVVRVRPTKKSNTKIKQKQFNELTGWSGSRVSQHARDAGMLIIDKLYGGNYKQQLIFQKK